MNSNDFSEPIKSCLWLDFFQSSIPLSVLTSPKTAVNHSDNIKIRYLQDKFELYIVKTTESVIKIVVYRNRLNLDEKPDDGYALKFYFTTTGFDEETQSAIMKHDDEKAGSTFMLTENVLKKATSTHVVFDVLVVIQMLEFKSLDENDQRKIRVEEYTSFLKRKLQKKACEQLGCILKNPELEDVFTGRLPLPFMRRVMISIAIMSKNVDKLVDYFKAKYNNKAVQLSDFEVNKLLNYTGLSDNEGPITIFEALELYFLSHRLGLDCFKTAASDYLTHILDKDYNVLDVLATALVVQDEDMIEKSILSFLGRFHEITSSAKFEYFIIQRGFITRVMIHSVRAWVSNHDVFIPGWDKTFKPTTEL